MKDTDKTKIIEKLNRYTPPKEAEELLQRVNILLLVGISGAGKDTIKEKLLETGNYYNIISHTTRLPRENNGILEKDGRDYYFISAHKMATMLDSHAFVEAKMYGTNVYGTSVEEVKRAYESNKIGLTDLDFQGVDEYMQLTSNVVPLFILPPTFDEWQQRLKNRYGKHIDACDLSRRLNQAKNEIAGALDKDYYIFFVNQQTHKTTESIDAFMQGRVSQAKFAKEQQQAKHTARKIYERLIEVI